MRLKIGFDLVESRVGFEMEAVAGTGYIDVCEVSDKAVSSEIARGIAIPNTGLLPPAVRYISPKRDILMWERPPGYVSFHFTNKLQENLQADQKSSMVFRLPVPWQIYVATISAESRLANLFMFFRKEQLHSLRDDPLYIAPIHNFFQDGRLCQAAFDQIPEHDPSLLGAVEAMFEGIWSSGFNVDTDRGWKMLANVPSQINPLRKHMNDPIKFYKAWTSHTLEQVMTWNWPIAFDSFDALKKSSNINYNQQTSNDHDFLLRLLFCAQDAANVS